MYMHDASKTSYVTMIYLNPNTLRRIAYIIDIDADEYEIILYNKILPTQYKRISA